MKILVIDDDDTIQEYVKQLLEITNLEHESAYTEAEAKEKFNKGGIDLFLIDINLGTQHENDGIDLCKYFKKIEPRIPVIMFTARDLKEFKIESFNYGADDYVIKPFSPEELIARIKRVLSRYGKEIVSNNKMRKVLIVEDDESVQNVLTNILKNNNCVCFTTNNTEDALKRVYEIEPDLIVLDLLLSSQKEHAAFEFLTFMKQTKKDLPIIILTGRYQEPADKTLGLNLGADDYILKPVEPDEFIARVNAIFRGFNK